MSSQEQRLKIAHQILDWEARRDSHGHLMVYDLPPDDGGGKYEVAGINEKYHPEEAALLKKLIDEEKFKEAEELATAYIATYTDCVTPWSEVVAIESFLRDCAFNRGPKGAARIYQLALEVSPDGIVGRITLAAAKEAGLNPQSLLQSLRSAREKHERRWVGRDESSQFWRGLVNRWDKALRFGLSFL